MKDLAFSPQQQTHCLGNQNYYSVERDDERAPNANPIQRNQ